MKKSKIVILLLILLIISGCSKTNVTSNQVVSTTASPSNSPIDTPPDIVNHTKQEVVEADLSLLEPEEVLSLFWETLIQKDYDALKDIIYTDNLDMSKDEFIKWLKEDDFKNNTDRQEYLISSIKDYDDKHKITETIVKIKTPAGEISSYTSVLGMFLINGEWKISNSLLISKELFSVDYDYEYLTVTRIDKLTFLDGYQYDIYYTNKSEEYQILTGWMNETTAVLETTTIPSVISIEKFNLGPLEEGFFGLPFYFESPTTPQHITIKGLYIGDKQGLPINNIDPFEISLPVDNIN